MSASAVLENVSQTFLDNVRANVRQRYPGISGPNVLATVRQIVSPTCPWCREPVAGHAVPALQQIFGFPVVICAFAPIGELIALAPFEERVCP